MAKNLSKTPPANITGGPVKLKSKKLTILIVSVMLLTICLFAWFLFNRGQNKDEISNQNPSQNAEEFTETYRINKDNTKEVEKEVIEGLFE